mmetsp:Transcript_8637/g.13261  ORF Transcript_8637/g.13261 Transcript_8637/m.13261 type:complete len:360 (-) Transcript_8637:615-1694(-)
MPQGGGKKGRKASGVVRQVFDLIFAFWEVPRVDLVARKRAPFQRTYGLGGVGGGGELDEHLAHAVRGPGTRDLHGLHRTVLPTLVPRVLHYLLVGGVIHELVGGDHVGQGDDPGGLLLGSPRGGHLPRHVLRQHVLPVQVRHLRTGVLRGPAYLQELAHEGDAVKVEAVVGLFDGPQLHKGKCAAVPHLNDGVALLQCKPNLLHRCTQKFLKAELGHLCCGAPNVQFPVELGGRVHHRSPFWRLLPREGLPGGRLDHGPTVLCRPPNLEQLPHKGDAVEAQAVVGLLRGPQLDEGELVGHPAPDDGVARRRGELHLVEGSVEELHEHQLRGAGRGVAHKQLSESLVCLNRHACNAPQSS